MSKLIAIIPGIAEQVIRVSSSAAGVELRCEHGNRHPHDGGEFLMTIDGRGPAEALADAILRAAAEVNRTRGYND